MSVPEPLRHKGRLEVHVKAQFLASYTAKILCNDKVFDPKTDMELINRIRNYIGEMSLPELIELLHKIADEIMLREMEKAE